MTRVHTLRGITGAFLQAVGFLPESVAPHQLLALPFLL